MKDILIRMTDAEKHIWWFGFTAGAITSAVFVGVLTELGRGFL